VTFVRLLIGQLVVPLLATLLVLSTPVGTGTGVHQDELLHPVLPHVHLINGHMVSDQQLATDRIAADPQTADTRATHGVAVGAGSNADAAGLGLALGPTLPAIEAVRATPADGRLLMAENGVPPEFRDEPQDPPPDHLA
jgi:hypothetical protein